MTSIKFGMFTTFYPPYNFGGDGVGIKRLSRALVARGHDVTVIHDADAYNALAPNPDPPPLDEHDGVRIITIRSRSRVISPLLSQQFGRPVLNRSKLQAILDKEKFDVLWYHNVSLIGGPGLLSMGTNAVKIYEAHEHWLVCPTHVLWRHGKEVCTGRECLRCVLGTRRPPQLWRYTGHLARQLHHVHRFIAKSEFSRSKHAEFGFPAEMEVVPYFLPEGATQSEIEITSPHSRPYYLFVGRLEKIKGLDDVIPLFDGTDGPDLVIAGDGTYASTLRELGDGKPRVKFLGSVKPDDLRAWYQHATALIVPSVCFETFGIILIESFRQGTPVLARRIGPFPEIVEKSGAGEIFADAHELREAMRRFEENPGRRESFSKAARLSFERFWSDEAVLPQYLDVVRQAAVKAGRSDVAQALTVESVS